MKIEDLRTKTDDELADELLNTKKEAFNLRFQKANGQVEQTHQMRELRRDVARIKTLLGERRQVAKS
ncbi:MAG: 50S ribosomal protein L29 [Alphaproteobacteria bacterium]|nr:50S ribosomal protein L29 [Alphaproteobacteria bacterium]